MKHSIIPATSSSDNQEGSRSSHIATKRTFLKWLALTGSVIGCNAFGASQLTLTPTVTPTMPLPPSTTPTTSPTQTPAATSTATSPPTMESPPTPLFIVDGHEDISWNWLEFKRDPRQGALEGRSEEDYGPVEATMGDRSTGLDEWLAGRVGIIFSSLFVMPEARAYHNFTSQVYSDAEEAYARASEQMDAYHQLAEEDARFCLITTRQELEDVVAGWRSADPRAHRIGLVVSMEGAEPIREPDEVVQWYNRGLRAVMPAWRGTRYAGGTGEPGPLTDAGRMLLAQMAPLNMILDLSHMAEEASREALDIYPGPVIASHSNPYSFIPTSRGVPDETIRRIGARGGTVGIMLYNRFLNPEWEYGSPPDMVKIDTVIDAINTVVQLTGSVESVAIGSDLDGGFGAEATPLGIDTVADLLKIGDALASHGYKAEEIEMIMNGNWLRILRSSLP